MGPMEAEKVSTLQDHQSKVLMFANSPFGELHVKVTMLGGCG